MLLSDWLPAGRALFTTNKTAGVTSLSSAWQVYSLVDGSKTRYRMNLIVLNDSIRIEPRSARNAL